LVEKERRAKRLEEYGEWINEGHDKNSIDCFGLRDLFGHRMVLLFDHPTRTTGH